MTPSRIQSALDSAGVQAARIEWLWWLMFWVSAAVFVIVLAALALAVRRGRSPDPARPAERTVLVGIAGATGVTILVLLGLLYSSAAIGRAIGTFPEPGALTVQIVGHQWWWEIQYLNRQPSLRVTTANELRLPVGRPVVFVLKSADVIHSFWIPNLHGKIDLVPGRENRTWLQADQAGTFRGQCGEYCGVQHAHMGLPVFAQAADEFDRWLDAQRRLPPSPATPEQARGRELFERGPCALCHTIRGTQAGGRLGPDLTHFGSRATIGAGMVPNTRGHLAAWIADPQHLKPGNRMPPTGLAPGDLQALIAYLETLR
jgi:cytochrome c oxidase subunit 2